jgi:hypothetical protein
MARYAAYRKRDLLVALACAKQAGIPLCGIKFDGEKGFELVVGEPQKNIEAVIKERKNSWSNVKPIADLSAGRERDSSRTGMASPNTATFARSTAVRKSA